MPTRQLSSGTLVDEFTVGTVLDGRLHVAQTMRVFKRSGLGRDAFFVVGARSTFCSVRPTHVRAVADEVIELRDDRVPRSFRSSRDRRSLIRNAIDGLALAEGTSVFRRCVQYEFGPFDCPNETPWQFSVRVFKQVGAKSAYVCIVQRRESYLLAGADGARSPKILDIQDDQFESQVHRTLDRSLRDIARQIELRFGGSSGNRGSKARVGATGLGFQLVRSERTSAGGSTHLRHLFRSLADKRVYAERTATEVVCRLRERFPRRTVSGVVEVASSVSPVVIGRGSRRQSDGVLEASAR